jgi:phosphatidylinositol alpha-1,6-mannosyltransferase
VALLSAGGLAVAVSLLVRPPHDLVAAADRLAVGLCVAFLLAPAGRFGYLALPLALAVLARLAGGAHRKEPVHGLVVRASRPARPVPAPVARGVR